MTTAIRYPLFFILLFFVSTTCNAQNLKPIKVKRIPSSLDGATLIAIGTDGQTSSATISNRSANVTPSTRTARLYIRDNGQVVALIGSPFCNKKKCVKKTVALAAKAGKRVNIGRDKGDGVLLAKGKRNQLRKAFNRSFRASRSNLSSAISSAGLSTASTQALASKKLSVRAIEELDSDNDGLLDLIDSDDDGDGILDNYDSDATLPTAEEGEDQTEFPVFSNFKLNIEQTINLHATGINTDTLDSLLASTQTLAIGVAGESGETTELDCGELSYCSAGGTGEALSDNSDFPGTAGGTNDVDGDGLGEIAEGSTGDFQLKTRASSSTIRGGDTFLQVVTDSDENERAATGMLNFVFNSTPAIRNLRVNKQDAETVDYTADSVLGSSANCFEAPISGDVTVTIEGWRPQRPGIDGAGEGDFVDLGLSLITADIPNAPCELSGGGSCSGSGPGNCASSSYSTSDSNLTVETNGIQDGRGDVNADSSNTYTFAVDLSDCLQNANGGAIAWNAGETLFIDLQFRSSFGDNAAQKFCVTRSST